MALQTLILPDVEYLRECFRYDPDTGKLFWRLRPHRHFSTLQTALAVNSKCATQEARSVGNHSYLQVRLDGQMYLQHRIIWKLQTGKEPPPFIDHKDLNRQNNCWFNLREATKSEQNWNSGVRKDNKSGYKGVTPSGKKWRASIGVNGAIYHIGSFSTVEEAAAAYEAEARKLHGEFWRTK